MMGTKRTHVHGKRALSLLLALTMMLTLAVPAWAEPEPETDLGYEPTTVEVTGTVRLANSELEADFTVEPDITVGALKAEIAASEALGCPAVEAQTLTLNDTALADEATLADCGVEDGAVLILTVAQPVTNEGNEPPRERGQRDPHQRGQREPRERGERKPRERGEQEPRERGR